jgi:ankyrin repeat protein
MKIHTTPRHKTPVLLAAFCAALLCGGCNLSEGAYSYATGNAMFGQKTYNPEEFFSGRQLEIARAMNAGDMALVRKLASGADLTAPGKEDMSLMWFAIVQQNYPAITTLVSLGVDPDKQVAKGIGSALYAAMLPRKDPNDQSGIRVLRAMLDGGLSPNYKDRYQTPLLYRAAGPGSTLAAVQLLLERGADINARDDLGGTALIPAIYIHPDIALYLINHGADVNIYDRGGGIGRMGYLQRVGRA